MRFPTNENAKRTMQVLWDNSIDADDCDRNSNNGALDLIRYTLFDIAVLLESMGLDPAREMNTTVQSLYSGVDRKIYENPLAITDLTDCNFEPDEPSDADMEAQREAIGRSVERYRADMNDAGRGRLLK